MKVVPWDARRLLQNRYNKINPTMITIRLMTPPTAAPTVLDAPLKKSCMAIMYNLLIFIQRVCEFQEHVFTCLISMMVKVHEWVSYVEQELLTMTLPEYPSSCSGLVGFLVLLDL